MSFKPILLVGGEPNSIFLEIFFKSLKKKNYKSPLILIASKKVLELQMKKLKFYKKIKLLNYKTLDKSKLDNQSINLINIEYETNKAYEKISHNSNEYIKNSFRIAFDILNSGLTNKLINGPISKKTFLNKKFLGITEYIANEYKIKKCAMLIYNKELSVCPITTHLPLKFISRKINKKLISEKVFLVDEFYKNNFKKKPKIAVVGLNPHCESISLNNEDEIIVRPSVEYLKKMGCNISGPYPADTIFLKNNRKKFDIIVGMYHDQVLTPLKTLYEYDAINITLGLPFIRVSPDHGPNEKMLGKNLSNPLSLIKAISFLDKK